MTGFTTEVENHFGFLEAAGYVVLVNEAATTLDQGLAIFRGERLSIQIARDRGSSYFEAGPLGGLRYPGHILGRVIARSRGEDSTYPSEGDVAAVSRWLGRMLPTIEAAFAPERAAETLTALRRPG